MTSEEVKAWGEMYYNPVGGVKRLFGKKKKRDTRPIWQQDQTGAYQMLGENYSAGGSGADFLNNLLQNFRGSQAELEKFMETMGPVIDRMNAEYHAGQIKGDKSYAYMADQGNWDLGAMGAYGQQAGEIGRQMQAQTDQAVQGMASQGLGRSSMRSAMTSAIQQQGITAQSNAYSAAQQRAAMNRMNSAMNMMDANRMIAQVAMGQQISPRMPGGGGAEGPSPAAGAAAGALSGMAAGATLGPWGALGGALVGGGLGYFGAKG